MALSDLAVRSAKSADKAYKLSDEKGLCCTNQFKAEFPLTPDGFMA